MAGLVGASTVEEGFVSEVSLSSSGSSSLCSMFWDDSTVIDQDDTISRSSVKFIEPAFKKNDLYFAISKRTVGWQQIQNRINEKLTAIMGYI